MILQKESMASERKESAINYNREEYDREYIINKWQDNMDIMASIRPGTTSLLYKVTAKGYDLILLGGQKKTYYTENLTLTSSGADFIDLVRAYDRLLIIEDGHKDERVKTSVELDLGYKTLIGSPLYDNQHRINGIFMVLSAEPYYIKKAEINRIKGLVNGLEESMKVLALRERLRAIKDVDSLTKLSTREHMMETLQLEFERSMRSDMPFSMVLIDIDNFKQINETFTHEVGDAVLREFAKIIGQRIRHIDMACRWDGNAFAILCPHTEMLGANQLVDDLFDQLTHHLFNHIGRCYFSMGVADYSPDDLNVNDMLIRLDKALYRVKAFGGNNHISKYH